MKSNNISCCGNRLKSFLEHFHRQKENDHLCMYVLWMKYTLFFKWKKKKRDGYFIHSFIRTYLHTFIYTLFCNCTHHVCHSLILTSGSPALFKCFFIHFSHPSTTSWSRTVQSVKPSSSSLELLHLPQVSFSFAVGSSEMDLLCSKKIERKQASLHTLLLLLMLH